VAELVSAGDAWIKVQQAIRDEVWEGGVPFQLRRGLEMGCCPPLFKK